MLFFGVTYSKSLPREGKEKMIEWSQYYWSITISEQVSFWHAPRQQQSLTINKTVIQGWIREFRYSHQHSFKHISGAKTELLECTGWRERERFFSHLLCIDVHPQNSTFSLLKWFWEDTSALDKEILEGCLISDLWGLMTGMRSRHWIPLFIETTNHKKKINKNCPNTDLSLTGTVSCQMKPESKLLTPAHF